MKKVFLGVVCLFGVAVIGCDQTQTIEGGCGNAEETAEAGAPFVNGEGGFGGAGAIGEFDPCFPFEETTLPASGLGDLIVICSSCDGNECANLGDTCQEYGNACDVQGKPGVCIGCCNGLSGELHCSPLP